MQNYTKYQDRDDLNRRVLCNVTSNLLVQVVEVSNSFAILIPSSIIPVQQRTSHIVATTVFINLSGWCHLCSQEILNMIFEKLFCFLIKSIGKRYWIGHT